MNVFVIRPVLILHKICKAELEEKMDNECEQQQFRR